MFKSIKNGKSAGSAPWLSSSINQIHIQSTGNFVEIETATWRWHYHRQLIDWPIDTLVTISISCGPCSFSVLIEPIPTGDWSMHWLTFVSSCLADGSVVSWPDWLRISDYFIHSVAGNVDENFKSNQVKWGLLARTMRLSMISVLLFSFIGLLVYNSFD